MIFTNNNEMKVNLINNRRKTGKFEIRWKFNNILLNNQWVKEIKREIRIYLGTNENGNTTCPNLWDAAKAGKFIVTTTYNEKENFK